jgi:hypothetical protein
MCVGVLLGKSPLCVFRCVYYIVHLLITLGNHGKTQYNLFLFVARYGQGHPCLTPRFISTIFSIQKPSLSIVHAFLDKAVYQSY